MSGADIVALREAAERARELLAILSRPKDHPGMSSMQLWTRCVEIENQLRMSLRSGLHSAPRPR